MGESVVVFGVGGVGLCAVAAAAARGANPVIAVDPRIDRRRLARLLGATHEIDPTDANWLETLQHIAPRGVDCAVEASGRPDVMNQALQSVRPQGGRAVIIGNAPHGSTLTIDPQQLNQGKRLLGSWGGDCVIERDLPAIAEQIEQGAMQLQELIGKTYSLEQVNSALDDLEQGVTARPVLDMALSD